MRNIYYLLNLLLVLFTLNKHSLVYTREALAELWDVADDELLNLLAIEEKLTIIDKTLQLLLEDFDSSSGGTYIDVKANKVFVNIVDPSIIPIIKNSPEIRSSDYLNFIIFKSAKNSMATLTNHLDKIDDLIEQFRPIHIQCYIGMEFNTIVIRHARNIKNKPFLNSTLQYNPLIIVPKVSFPHPRCHEDNNDMSQLSILSRNYLIPEFLGGE
ncbi:25541_t:CDS:1, partial [Gigaspora margarita]